MIFGIPGPSWNVKVLLISCNEKTMEFNKCTFDSTCPVDSNTKRTRVNATKAFAPKKYHLWQNLFESALSSLWIACLSKISSSRYSQFCKRQVQASVKPDFEARQLLQNRPDHPYPAMYLPVLPKRISAKTQLSSEFPAISFCISQFLMQSWVLAMVIQ